MSARRSEPFTFSPAGLSDALSGSHVFSGACYKLQNLIPDPTTKNLWICRPAAVQLTNFAGFTTPGFVSCFKVVGSRVFGMLATGRNAGHDEPFVYDLVTRTFITVTGVTSANTPISPASSGAWSPPQIAVMGKYVIVTHPGFPGGAGAFFGWFDNGNPAAPVWSAGNTTGTALPYVPQGVAVFNGRAWFAINPTIYSALVPSTYTTDAYSLNIGSTPVTQILTYDDNIPITALAGLGLFNQSGGVVQSLLVFKGTTNIYQVTGDFATGYTISRNSLNTATSTESPLAIVNAPEGLMFIAPDGLRTLDYYAKIQHPVGIAGEGVNAPFIYNFTPSRVVAACNASLVRISVQNSSKSGAPWEEYWYDLTRKVWSGPHTFVPSAIDTYRQTFIVAPQGITGSLWQSDVVPNTTSVYTENGTQLTWDWYTTIFPDAGQMCVYNFQETTINMALDVNMNQYIVSLINPQNTVYDSLTNSVVGTPPIWDVSIWDAVVWDGISSGLTPRRVNWTKPNVTSRAQMRVQGSSAAGVKLGDIKFNVEIVPYVPQTGI
jgi:hypothetical protein